MNLVIAMTDKCQPFRELPRIDFAASIIFRFPEITLPVEVVQFHSRDHTMIL
jgi:hypothetical protein